MFRVGVDLGGTNISVGVIDDNLKIIGRAKTKTAMPRSANEILDDIIMCVEESCNKAGVDITQVESIGVGAPGSVDVKSGVVEFSNNLNFKNTPIKEYIENKLHIPVYVTNDANCAALGEKCVGTGKGTKDFIAITIGTGIGGGIFVGDKMLTGINGSAGEVGHIVIDFNGDKCNCDRLGCWERYASATALKMQTKEALKSDKNKNSCIWKLIKDDLSNINGRTAFDAMRMGDALGSEIVDTYISYLACGITNLINLFQPEVLCIGGGVSNEGDTLLEPVVKLVERDRYSRYSSKQTKICIAQLKNDAGIIGAALLNEV